jgi:hypothetical protein
LRLGHQIARDQSRQLALAGLVRMERTAITE